MILCIYTLHWSIIRYYHHLYCLFIYRSCEWRERDGCIFNGKTCPLERNEKTWTYTLLIFFWYFIYIYFLCPCHVRILIFFHECHVPYPWSESILESVSVSMLPSSDHQALRYVNFQKRIWYRHIKYLEFIQKYTFMLKHCASLETKVVDALYRMLCTWCKDDWFWAYYPRISNCWDFGDIWTWLTRNPHTTIIEDFTIVDSFFSRCTCL